MDGDPGDPLSETAFTPDFLRRLERLSIAARRTLRGVGRGERRSQRRGGTVEFADYRAYAPGDDTRGIDWYAYARLDALFLKLYVEEQDLTVHLLLDRSASMTAGSPEKLAHGKRAAAALGYVALSSGDRVTVRAFAGGERGPQLAPVRGRRGFLKLLRFLDEEVTPEGPTSLASLSKAFVARRPTPGVVLLFSDFLDPAGYDEALERLRYSGYEPFALHVVAPEEEDPRVGPDVELVDLETGASLNLSLDGAAIEAYRARFAAFVARLEAFCKRHEIGCARIRTDVPFEATVTALLERRVLLS